VPRVKDRELHDFTREHFTRSGHSSGHTGHSSGQKIKSSETDKTEDTDQNQQPHPRGSAPNPTGTSSYCPPCCIDEDWVESVRLPSTPTQQACAERRRHVWIDVLHTTQQCSACGKLRTNPVVTQWTAADDLEAEYLEFVENYDPDDPYWSVDVRGIDSHVC
jgi:hypothetical protein